MYAGWLSYKQPEHTLEDFLAIASKLLHYTPEEIIACVGSEPWFK